VGRKFLIKSEIAGMTKSKSKGVPDYLGLSKKPQRA
jgi:hypothetical protein